MIKRTLYFGNPAYLSYKMKQLVIRLVANDPDEYSEQIRTVPVEDIGVVVVDNQQVTFTSGLMAALLEENVALVPCDYKHIPTGLMLSLQGHSSQNQRFRNQLEASLPLKKQLWQQTVECKIRNQAAVLKYVSGEDAKNKLRFVRDQFGEYPNNLLNYGYAILRAIVARALVASGMLPLLGIHHHNKYNDYCLADDIMEPYRPFVDRLVLNVMDEYPDDKELNKNIKARLLTIPVLDVNIDGHKSPLMVAVSTTTASLYKCFSGVCRKIVYPSM